MNRMMMNGVLVAAIALLGGVMYQSGVEVVEQVSAAPAVQEDVVLEQRVAVVEQLVNELKADPINESSLTSQVCADGQCINGQCINGECAMEGCADGVCGTSSSSSSSVASGDCGERRKPVRRLLGRIRQAFGRR